MLSKSPGILRYGLTDTRICDDPMLENIVSARYRLRTRCTSGASCKPFIAHRSLLFSRWLGSTLMSDVTGTVRDKPVEQETMVHISPEVSTTSNRSQRRSGWSAQTFFDIRGGGIDGCFGAKMCQLIVDRSPKSLYKINVYFIWILYIYIYIYLMV